MHCSVIFAYVSSTRADSKDMTWWFLSCSEIRWCPHSLTSLVRFLLERNTGETLVSQHLSFFFVFSFPAICPFSFRNIAWWGLAIRLAQRALCSNIGAPEDDRDRGIIPILGDSWHVWTQTLWVSPLGVKGTSHNLYISWAIYSSAFYRVHAHSVFVSVNEYGPGILFLLASVLNTLL